MNPSAPDRRPRIPVRGLLVAAATSVLVSAASLPASADPSAPGTGGEHYATARIATVEWCNHGPIGDVNTDRADGDAAADWRSDGDQVGGEHHFSTPPSTAYSAVARDTDSLVATATVSDIRFTPDCTRTPASAGSAGESVALLAEAFDAEDLVSLESAESTSRWSTDRGARAEMTVEGLTVLDRPADVADGAYETTFTEELEDGGAIAADVTAEQHVSTLSSDGAEWHTTASAWLAIRFDIVELDENGDPVRFLQYRLDFASTAVHSEYGVQLDPSPSPDPSPTASAAPSTDPDPSPSPRPSPSQSASPSASPAPPEPSAAIPGDDPPVSAKSGGRLPVTGSALVGLIATGMAALCGGGAAVFLGRRRKSGFDGDEIGD